MSPLFSRGDNVRGLRRGFGLLLHCYLDPEHLRMHRANGLESDSTARLLVRIGGKPRPQLLSLDKFLRSFCMHLIRGLSVLRLSGDGVDPLLWRLCSPLVVLPYRSPCCCPPSQLKGLAVVDVTRLFWPRALAAVYRGGWDQPFHPLPGKKWCGWNDDPGCLSW